MRVLFALFKLLAMQVKKTEQQKISVVFIKVDIDKH